MKKGFKSKKTTLKRKNFYGLEEFEKDMEKERGPLTFGRLLESHRKCEELTQEELGNMAGLSGANICDLEKGRKIPPAKRAWKIAAALQMYEPYWVQIALQDYLREQKLDLKASIASCPL